MQECRLLSPHDDWLRRQIKASYLGLASLERTIARQRGRITMLKEGDANTAVYHRQCSYRGQKNHIHALTVDGQVITGQEEMAQAAFAHSDELFGCPAARDCSLDLDHLIEPCDPAGLDEPFSPEEIWNAIKLLPARKAPGPDVGIKHDLTPSAGVSGSCTCMYPSRTSISKPSRIADS